MAAAVLRAAVLLFGGMLPPCAAALPERCEPRNSPLLIIASALSQLRQAGRVIVAYMNAQLPHWLRALLDRLAFRLFHQNRPAVAIEPFPETRASHIAERR